MRVIKKTETEVVLAIEVRQSNSPDAEVVQTIDRTKSFVAQLHPAARPENTHELARGTELLTVHGTPFHTNWVEYWHQSEEQVKGQVSSWNLLYNPWTKTE